MYVRALIHAKDPDRDLGSVHLPLPLQCTPSLQLAEGRLTSRGPGFPTHGTGRSRDVTFGRIRERSTNYGTRESCPAGIDLPYIRSGQTAPRSRLRRSSTPLENSVETHCRCRVLSGRSLFLFEIESTRQLKIPFKGFVNTYCDFIVSIFCKTFFFVLHNYYCRLRK